MRIVHFTILPYKICTEKGFCAFTTANLTVLRRWLIVEAEFLMGKQEQIRKVETKPTSQPRIF